MSKDMSTDRFTAVGTSEKSAGAGVALDLVRLQTSENDPGKGKKKKMVWITTMRTQTLNSGRNIRMALLFVGSQKELYNVPSAMCANFIRN